MKNQKLIYLNVPVALCEYVIINKLINPFRLFLYLKTLGHKFQMNNILVRGALKTLKISSKKTLETNLKKLVDINWIGFNQNNNTFFVRGFETLLYNINAKRSIGVEFHKSNFKYFRGFLGGAVFGYLSALQHWKQMDKNKGRAKEPSTGGSSQLVTPPCFYPVSVSGVSTILSISLSTAHTLKELACKSKHIITLDNHIPIDIDPTLLMQYLRSAQKTFGKVRVDKKRNKVYEIGPLLVKSNMQYKRRKKTKHIMGDCRGGD
jgi:hypothetical protein